jgi:hypothetical protein
MSIGLNAVMTKATLDNDVGRTASMFHEAFERIRRHRHFFVITPDATLVALGYTAAEVATMKSAFADGDLVRQAVEGSITLPQLDYRLNLDLLAGDLVA